MLDALASIFGVATRGRLAAGRAGSTRHAGAPLNILVAEDNAVNRTLVTTLLEKRGHRVEAVENGREALTAVEQRGGDFDVILMDVQMPEMGGFEATRAIRSGEGPRPDRALPIVASDRACDVRRPRAMPRRRDGRLSHQAHRRGRSDRHRRAIR